MSSSAEQALRRCATESGFLAAPEPRDNYRRVWARDGCVCVLAALSLRDAELDAAALATLDTLAAHQGPSGQIPSNVGRGDVSYGTTAGRLDATSWFVVAGCRWARERDPGWLGRHRTHLARAEGVLRAWEHNDRGLIYTPATGNWADEYPLAGHLLYDQMLYVWAKRELDALRRAVGDETDDRLREVLEPAASRFVRDGEVVAGFDAGHVHPQLDGWGAALWIELGLGDEELRRRLVERAAAISRFDLVPAFDPPTREGDDLWPALGRAARGELRNHPGHYHNGGLWPVITAFWVRAARALGDEERARRWARGIAEANAKHGFPEYLAADTGEPGGHRPLAWSAAAEILA